MDSRDITKLLLKVVGLVANRIVEPSLKPYA